MCIFYHLHKIVLLEMIFRKISLKRGSTQTQIGKFESVWSLGESSNLIDHFFIWIEFLFYVKYGSIISKISNWLINFKKEWKNLCSISIFSFTWSKSKLADFNHLYLEVRLTNTIVSFFAAIPFLVIPLNAVKSDFKKTFPLKKWKIYLKSDSTELRNKQNENLVGERKSIL